MELKVNGIVSEDLKKRLGITVTEDSIILFAGFSEYEIPLGSLFNIVEADKEIKAKLIFITQQYGKSFEFIPKGWKTIIVLKFENRIPDVLRELPILEDWYESGGELILKVEA